MAVLDFPASPTVGQTYPSPATPGLPVYVWDGEKWASSSSGAGAAASDVTFAPAGGIAATNVQDALVELDNEKVAKAGDTMTGALTLPGAPTVDLHAATKKYVDDAILGGTGTSLFVSTTPPPGAADGSLWWESDSGLLYIRYNDGAGASQWVMAAPVPDVSAYVKKTGDVMTGMLTLAADPTVALHAATKSYVDSGGGAGDVYGLQINGSHEFSQIIGASVVVYSNSGGFVTDQWRVSVSGAGGFAITCQQNGGPDFPSGFTSMLKLTNTSGLGTVAAGDYAYAWQMIEYNRARRLRWGNSDAVPVTIAFWFKSYAVGAEIAVFVRNDTAPYQSYVVKVPTTTTGWEYKTVTIPPPPVGTTWNTSFVFGFTFVAGTTYQAAANTWVSGPGGFMGTSTTTNYGGYGGAPIYLTGVLVLPGSAAPSAANSPLAQKHAPDSLHDCLRYYETGFFIFGSVANAAQQQHDTIYFSTLKRITPAVTVTSPVGSNVSSWAVSGASLQSASAWISATATGPMYLQGNYVADARI